jgi:hypothetical protein
VTVSSSRITAAVTGDGELVFHLQTRDAVLRVHGIVLPFWCGG